jgi:hypothetical protein
MCNPVAWTMAAVGVVNAYQTNKGQKKAQASMAAQTKIIEKQAADVQAETSNQLIADRGAEYKRRRQSASGNVAGSSAGRGGGGMFSPRSFFA